MSRRRTCPPSRPVEPDDPTDPEEEGGLGSLVEGINVDEELPDYISNQKEGVYTFLLIGRTTMDDNSDMLMLIVFDTNTGEINACSIPRDTMINLSSDVKKINSTIWGGVNNTMNWVRKTLGVYPNFYVMVDWAAVGELVEAVGGVYFDVPCRMYYVDSNPKGPFTIDLEEGYQLLDGDKAMQLIRWRHNAPGYEHYATEAGFDGSNTKRTEMQQEFIVAAAKQILQVKNLPYLGSMVQVFSEHVETNLSIGNLAWFAQKALTLGSADKVTFHTLPANYSGSCYSRTQHNYQSYVTFQQSALLELVNTYLNPYEGTISLGDLDLMRINSDGSISSSTGTVADSAHNQLISDVNSGLAYFYKSGSSTYVGYYETEDPDGEDPTDPDSPTDPNDPTNPGDPTDPSNPADPDDPLNPVDPTDPSQPADPDDPAGPTDPGQDPSSPETDPTQPVIDPGQPGSFGGETGDGGETAPGTPSGGNPQQGGGQSGGMTAGNSGGTATGGLAAA